MPAALVDLISTVQTWEISSGIFFGDLFGGGGRRRANNGPMKGANLRARVNITFEEAVFGCDKELEIVLRMNVRPVMELVQSRDTADYLSEM